MQKLFRMDRCDAGAVLLNSRPAALSELMGPIVVGLILQDISGRSRAVCHGRKSLWFPALDLSECGRMLHEEFADVRHVQNGF